MTTSTTTEVRSRVAGTEETIVDNRGRAESIMRQDMAFIPNLMFEERSAKRKLLGRELNLDFEPERQSSHTARMPSHLARLCDSPLLQHDEEKDLFCRMNFLLYRANALRSKLSLRRPSEAKMDEIEACLEQANAVKNRIVAANIRLVVSIVKQLASTPSAFDEMLSEGLLAMMRSVEKFDFDRGFRFSTYATMVIRRQLYRSMKNDQRDRTRFPSADHALLSEHAEHDSDPRIGFRGWNRLNESLTSMITQLDQREQLIIRARFGFDTDGKKQTLQSLAKQFGVCKERVRQLEKRAMVKLRLVATSMNLESFVDPEFAID